MERWLETTIDACQLDCVFSIHYSPDANEEVPENKPVWELKYSSDRVFLHHIGISVDKTVIIPIRLYDASKQTYIVPREEIDFTDPTIKSFLDDIRNIDDIRITRQGTYKICDWLSWFMRWIYHFVREDFPSPLDPNVAPKYGFGPETLL